MYTDLCRRCRAVEVSLIIQLLKLLQCGAGPLGQTDNNRLAIVVTDWQASRRSFVIKQVIDFVAVDFIVAHRDLDRRLPSRILLQLAAAPEHCAEKPGDDASIRQRFPASHRVRLAGTSDSIRKERNVEAFE